MLRVSFQMAVLGRFELHVSWMRIRYTRPTIRKSLVGRGGNAPPKSEDNEFTVHPVILSGTYQFLARKMGYDPTTFGSTVRSSNQLSYSLILYPNLLAATMSKATNGTSGRTCTGKTLGWKPRDSTNLSTEALKAGTSPETCTQNPWLKRPLRYDCANKALKSSMQEALITLQQAVDC